MKIAGIFYNLLIDVEFLFHVFFCRDYFNIQILQWILVKKNVNALRTHEKQKKKHATFFIFVSKLN